MSAADPFAVVARGYQNVCTESTVEACFESSVSGWLPSAGSGVVNRGLGYFVDRELVCAEHLV